MKCPGCGEDVLETSVYCHRCGARVDQQRPPSSEPQEENRSAAPETPAERPPNPLSPQDRMHKAAAGRQGLADEPGEELWRGQFSSKAMFGSWVLCGVVTVALLVVGAIWVRDVNYWLALLGLIAALWIYHLLLLYYRQLSIRYRLTNHRFIHEKGVLRKVTDRIEVIEMEDVTFEQGPFERLTGVGTIHVVSSDRSHPELTVRGIEDVRHVAGLLDTARRQERVRRGLHIQSY